jgi:hypothetical protein
MSYLALQLPGGGTIVPPNSVPKGGLSFVQGVFSNALSLMIVAAVVLVIIFIVWSGIQWVTSNGDKGKIAAARARLTWAVIGLIIVLATFFILNFIGYLFKVNLLKVG